MKKLTLVATALLVTIASIEAIADPIFTPTYTMTVTNTGLNNYFLPGAPAQGGFFIQFRPLLLNSDKYKVICDPISCVKSYSNDNYPLFTTTSQLQNNQSEVFSITLIKTYTPFLGVLGVSTYTPTESNGWNYGTDFTVPDSGDGIPQNTSITTWDSPYYVGTCKGNSRAPGPCD